MKKHLVITLLAAMTASVLFGCSSIDLSNISDSASSSEDLLDEGGSDDSSKADSIDEASLDDMKTVIPTATAECLALFNPRKSVEGRALEGGTAPIRVAEQIARWQELLKE